MWEPTSPRQTMVHQDNTQDSFDRTRGCLSLFTRFFSGGTHQEITLVYICRIRMRLYVIKSLNDIYMSNNF